MTQNHEYSLLQEMHKLIWGRWTATLVSRNEQKAARMSQTGGASWTSMNENLMALLEAVLSLAASDATSRRPPRPAIKPGGYSEEIFVDLTEDEQDEFSCGIW